MNPDEFPAPEEGFVITHLLVVADQDRSREFYRSLFEGQVVLERDPVIMKVANTWLMLNVGGGPTDDKPGVTLTTPPDPGRTSGLNRGPLLRVARAELSRRAARHLISGAAHLLSCGPCAEDYQGPLLAARANPA
jgi:hypothetical protein